MVRNLCIMVSRCYRLPCQFWSRWCRAHELVITISFGGQTKRERSREIGEDKVTPSVGYNMLQASSARFQPVIWISGTFVPVCPFLSHALGPKCPARSNPDLTEELATLRHRDVTQKVGTTDPTMVFSSIFLRSFVPHFAEGTWDCPQSVVILVIDFVPPTEHNKHPLEWLFGPFLARSFWGVYRASWRCKVKRHEVNGSHSLNGFW